MILTICSTHQLMEQPTRSNKLQLEHRLCSNNETVEQHPRSKLQKVEQKLSSNKKDVSHHNNREQTSRSKLKMKEP